MHIFELTIPGTWISSDDRDWAGKMSGQLEHLKASFFEANVALNLFDEAYGYRPATPMATVEEWQAERARRDHIRQQVLLEATHQRNRPDVNVELEVERRFKVEKWHAGTIPSALERPKIHIYARAFIYALDAFSRFLDGLSKEPRAPEGVAKALEVMHQAFPNLRQVRNSSQHADERLRGLGTNRKPMELKPVQTESISAPRGILISDTLDNRNFTCTMGDGHVGQVEISAASMQQLTLVMQGVISSFTWRGRAQHLPS